MAASSSSLGTIIDLATDIPQDVLRFNGVLLQLAHRLECKTVTGLSSCVFTLSEIHDAFRLLKSGRNVGKVVVISPYTQLATPSH